MSLLNVVWSQKGLPFHFSLRITYVPLVTFSLYMKLIVLRTLCWNQTRQKAAFWFLLSVLSSHRSPIEKLKIMCCARFFFHCLLLRDYFKLSFKSAAYRISFLMVLTRLAKLYTFLPIKIFRAMKAKNGQISNRRLC